MGLRSKKYRKKMLPFSISLPVVTNQRINSLKRERLMWRAFFSMVFFIVAAFLIWILSMFELEIAGLTKLGYLSLITIVPLVVLSLTFLARSIFGLSFIDKGLKPIPMEGIGSVDWALTNAKEGTAAFFYLRDVFKSRPGHLTRYEFGMLLKYIKRDEIYNFRDHPKEHSEII